MKRMRCTEEQIISILKQQEAGASVPDLSRRHAVADNAIYPWKSTFGSTEVSEAKRLRVIFPLSPAQSSRGKLMISGSLSCVLSGRQIAQGTMWAFPVVMFSPGVDDSSRIGEIPEPVLNQASAPERAVEALDKCILSRLARLNEMQPVSRSPASQAHRIAGQLAAVSEDCVVRIG